jgi:hypothetical protein
MELQISFCRSSHHTFESGRRKSAITSYDIGVGRNTRGITNDTHDSPNVEKERNVES